MNVWLDITSEVFKGGRQIYIQMKAYVLPFKNIISFLNLPNFIHTLKSLRVHRHSFKLPVFSVGTNQHYLVKKYK